jgi:hypothetical protein
MKTKEDKIIEKSQNILEDISKLHTSDNRIVVEYAKLFDEYKKLSKRFNKTMKMNDSNDLHILKNTESLKDTVDYTIKKAREKILNNASEQRKTKDFYSEKIAESNETIKQLQKKLDIAHQRINELETKQTTGKGLLNHTSSSTAEEINLPIFKGLNWQSILSKEIQGSQNFNKELFVAKLTIDNYEQLIASMQDSGTVTGFYKAIVKYLSVTLNKTIVYYSHDNIIYLIFSAISEVEVKETIQKLNSKKEFNGIIILFSAGIAKFKNDSDTFATINEKCSIANEQASKLEKNKINLTFVI